MIVPVQTSMAATILAAISFVHWSFPQLANSGMMVSHWLLRMLKAWVMSPFVLFATISGTAPAKAMTPAVRTVKIVEKRMAKRLAKKRLEKATLAEGDWGCR